MAGKEGLNVQCCNRVIFVEPGFNPKAEEQAMDRCHRYGQKKTVHVYKLFIKGVSNCKRGCCDTSSPQNGSFANS